MPLNEAGIDHANTSALPAVEVERDTAKALDTLNQAGTDRDNLGQSIENQWPDVPAHAVKYLATNSKGNMPLAIVEARKLMAEDPVALDDPEIAPFLLDDCIEKAEIAALDEQERNVDGENAVLDDNIEQGKRRNESLSKQIDEIFQQEAKRGGGVDALIDRVSGKLAELPEGEAREAAEKKLAAVKAMLGQMRSVVNDTQEKAAFESILASGSFNFSAQTTVGMMAPIMAKVEASEAISETTKAQLRHISGIDTGSEVDDVLDAVDENGKPAYTKENPLPVRKGLNAYVDNDGDRIARVEVDGVGVREIPWKRGERGEIIGLKLSLLKIYAVNEAKGNTDFMGETVHIDTQILSQTDPEKLRKTQQIMEAIIGGNAGYNGEIVSNEDAHFIGWFNQYVATKGDAAEGDYDKTTALENRTNLGIHPDGEAAKIDYDVLRAAGSFAQAQYGSGSPDYFALQKHLHKLFRDRVPLTGKNASNGDMES